MSDWPPKLTMTPEGTAGLFLRYRVKANCTKEDVDAMAKLLKEYWFAGFKNALEQIASAGAEGYESEIEKMYNNLKERGE